MLNGPFPIYAEDLEVGTRIHLGTYEVSEEEVLEFGRRWDDLPIHTCPSKAASSQFGGLIASGVHTMAMNQSLMSRKFISHLAIVAGKGIREMRLDHPVRPGDTLSCDVTIVSIDLRDGRADLTTRASMVNQDGQQVLDLTGVTVIRRRPPG
ncbi:MaoC family dehydratase N-terminal domain-containing protein [Rhodococcus pseudokoreensis]|uniref:MaoC family dehydratase N-terminal domain-containing protein n=1 Tax=Rhodococcus pseudokoreensis TaxID=2811421 RepID=A0A974W3W5_9NOCA|nr:MaoC/PaaZ C-terminal domain-containing protein [Rhodococcus pseudokoreensis]QSE90788.1 MaoC family dehydratase N-terminal domain-containing protein [Rhodococcus pseudokoreensis]